MKTWRNTLAAIVFVVLLFVLTHFSAGSLSSFLSVQVVLAQLEDNDVVERADAWQWWTSWHRQETLIPQGEFAIIAHRDENFVESLPLAEGVTVRLLIFDHRRTLLWSGEQASFLDEDGVQFRANFYPGESYQLKPGDHLWMTDGKTVDEMVITNLTLQKVDPENWKIFGSADPGSEVIIEHISEEVGNLDKYFTVQAGADGAWSASIAGVAPGTWVMVSQDSSDNDLTRMVFFLAVQSERPQEDGVAEDGITSFFSQVMRILPFTIRVDG